jgi:phosphopentomutase
VASYGKMKEVSSGKDSTTGHWELGGVKLDFDFSYFPTGFPEEIIKKFLALTGIKGYLGNIPASGTEIINQLGDEHIKTGYPIIYTSADSVFQIAAHEEVISLQELYRICKITREKVLTLPYKVARVIARPFAGESGKYERTTNRKDFSLSPPSDTILDILTEKGIKTVGIGKINDLFNYRGIKKSIITKSNKEGIRNVIKEIKENSDSFILVNLVDFDVYYGHRNDPAGFARALREFDDSLPEILGVMDKSDTILLTADHGNDPTTPSTDHSREFVPILLFKEGVTGRDLGVRETFSDAAKTVAEFFNIPNNFPGKSFLI